MSGFTVGDVVRLKSGSPALTVLDLRDGDSLTVAWWDENSGDFKTKGVSAAILEPIDA